MSGTRFWGWARSRFGTAERFFDRVFVANWCPLVFMEASGRNRPPDKLPAAERAPLFEACNDALAEIADTLQRSLVVGIGGFAEKRAREALGYGSGSAASSTEPGEPAAYANWDGLVDGSSRSASGRRAGRRR